MGVTVPWALGTPSKFGHGPSFVGQLLSRNQVSQKIRVGQRVWQMEVLRKKLTFNVILKLGLKGGGGGGGGCLENADVIGVSLNSDGGRGVSMADVICERFLRAKSN